MVDLTGKEIPRSGASNAVCLRLDDHRITSPSPLPGDELCLAAIPDEFQRCRDRSSGLHLRRNAAGNAGQEIAVEKRARSLGPALEAM